jgi:hypothetical protein
MNLQTETSIGIFYVLGVPDECPGGKITWKRLNRICEVAP